MADVDVWANGADKQAANAAEASLRNTERTSKEEGEKEIIRAVGAALLPALNAAIIATIATHDNKKRGLHTWGGPNQRP